MTSLAGTAPCGPDVDKHHLTFVTVKDCLEYVFRGHVIELLNEDTLLTGQLLSNSLLLSLILVLDVFTVFVLHSIESGFNQDLVVSTHNE